MKKRKRSLAGAVICAVVVLVFDLLFAGYITWIVLHGGGPKLMLLMMLIAPAAIAVGVVAALVLRVRELKKGESDDAADY